MANTKKINVEELMKTMEKAFKEEGETRYKRKLKEETQKTQIKNKAKEIAKKETPESGADAVDRLLGDYKTARGKILNAKQEPIVPGLEDEKITLKDIPKRFLGVKIPFTEEDKKIDNPMYDEKGTPGSPYNIGADRVSEVKSDLELAQKAKKKGISFQEAKRNKAVREKEAELYKLFNIPGINPKKAKYLARLSTLKYFSKNAE